MARCQRCNKFMFLKSSSGYCKDCDALNAEEERKRVAEEARRAEEERQRKAEEERKRKEEEERRRKAEEERRRKEEEERQRKAEEERRRKEEEERQRNAEEHKKNELKASQKSQVIPSAEGEKKYKRAKELQKEEKHTEAFKLFKQAADLGSSEACNELGECYFYGNGVDKDASKAFQWYMKGAEAGNAAAQGNIGYCYANGVGTAQDYEKSFIWLQKAADQGNADALLNLGNRYQEGQGVKKNPEKAFSLYIEAAEKGNPMGNFAAGIMLYTGDVIKQDYKKAYELFTKCANETNHRQARYYAGEMSLLGKGIPKDLTMASVHLSLSASQGYPDAIDLIDKYGSSLFSDEITNAFYNWIMAQTVRYSDMRQSPDAKMFGITFYCRNKGMDDYTTIGIVASQLMQLAFDNINSEQRVKINFVKLARKWVH